MAFCLVADTDFLNLLDSELCRIDRIPIYGTVSSMAISADLFAYVAISNMVHIFKVGTDGFDTAHTRKVVAQDESTLVKVVSVSPAGCVYTLCGDYTVTKWSRCLQVRLNSIEFEAMELPFSLSCFGDTEDVLVGYSDGSFAVFDKYCICQLKQEPLVNSPVTVVHGKNNYILIGQHCGLCSYYKIINYRLADARLLSDGQLGSKVIGGGVCYNEWLDNQCVPDSFRLLIIAGTSDGRIYIEFPVHVPVACQSFHVNQTMFELKVTSHGLWMYAGCDLMLLRFSQNVNPPSITHYFTPVGHVTAIAHCGM